MTKLYYITIRLWDKEIFFDFMQGKAGFALILLNERIVLLAWSGAGIFVKTVLIYTDGACSGNPGPGGWGCLLIYGDQQRELSGAEADTTNQRMELQAAVAGLSALKEPCRVLLYSDSAYLVNGFRQGWLANWQKNGWVNSKKEPVANQDLWQELGRLAQIHQVEWHKVRGHQGQPENERCDELARKAINKKAKT